jgi:hypothetical protein
MEAGSDAAGNFEGIGRGYVRFALEHRGHFRVMFRPELKNHATPGLLRASAAASEILERAVARLQEAGIVAPGDTKALFVLAWSAVHGASALWIDGPLPDRGFVPDGEALASMVAGTTTRLLVSGARARAT